MKTGRIGVEPIRVLAVDDNPASLRLLESILSRCEDYVVTTATNGRETLDYLNSRPGEVDIILLDRMMPEMDGIEVCEAMKADEKLRYIPIIMQTAASRPEEISEGIRAGVFYYLTKPLISETLLSVVGAAAKQVKQLRQLRREMVQRKMSLGLVQVLKCTYRTLVEGESLATFLANFFPDTNRALTGISELLINAVEHGNLGITYDVKSRLVKENTLTEEINSRLADPRYSNRQVTVIFERKEDSYYLQITDEGDGFDWKQYLSVDPSRAMHNHGRGIAMANMLSFDKLIFNSKGNQVTGIITKVEERSEEKGTPARGAIMPRR